MKTLVLLATICVLLQGATAVSNDNAPNSNNTKWDILWNGVNEHGYKLSEITIDEHLLRVYISNPNNVTGSINVTLTSSMMRHNHSVSGNTYSDSQVITPDGRVCVKTYIPDGADGNFTFTVSSEEWLGNFKLGNIDMSTLKEGWRFDLLQRGDFDIVDFYV